MVSHEAADVFVYDALSNAAIRKLLFDRKVESRQVYVEDYQLGMAGNSDLTLLRGKGITVGEVFRLYPEEEIDLVKKFTPNTIDIFLFIFGFFAFVRAK